MLLTLHSCAAVRCCLLRQVLLELSDRMRCLACPTQPTGMLMWATRLIAGFGAVGLAGEAAGVRSPKSNSVARLASNCPDHAV